MDISTVGVIGLGTMGAGIAEVFARGGLEIVAVEVNDDLLDAGRARLTGSLQRAVDRGKLPAAEAAAINDRLRFTTDRRDLAVVDLVTEAVPERLDIKTVLFAELNDICQPETVFATNTSSLPVTAIAAASGRPKRLVGLHFFNPAPVMKLVEVLSTVLTAPEVTAAVTDLATACGKTPVAVGDRAGFVANALLFGYLNDAAHAAETEQAAVAEIDAGLVAATGFPMGPLTLLDLIGLDVSLDVLETMYDDTRDQRYAAAPLLRRLVMAGRLGRKSGAGYYDYSQQPPVAAVGRTQKPVAGDSAGDVVAVIGESTRLPAVFSGVPVVGPNDVAGGGVVLIDGGSSSGTAELAARVSRASSDAVLALVTTDQAPVATLAAGVADRGRVVGVHVPLTPKGRIVELVRTIESTPEALDWARGALAAIGGDNTPTIVVCKDRPGHVIDALLLPHLGDAVRMVGDSYASDEAVDTAMRLGCGYPAGPFQMLEAVGADELRSRLLHLSAATHRAGLAPAPLLDELAASGRARPSA